MRRLLIALAIIAMAGWSRPGYSEPTAIKKLKVVVRTGDAWGAGTRDAVWFSLGPEYEWTLDLPGQDVFHTGRSTTFTLPANGLKVQDVKWIKLRKSRGGDGGRWLLQGVEVWINGRPYYRNSDIATWLDDAHLDWSASDFPARVEGKW